MKLTNVKVSVIIPTFNSWITLKPCIDSIYKQTLSPYEILIVDNGSSDKTSIKLKKYFPKIKVITLERNTGVTGGRNTGIEKSSNMADYLLFFDHDMVADKDMIKQLVLVALENDSYGIVTPKIYYQDDRKRVWAAGTNINLWTGQVLFRGGVDKGQFDNPEEVQVAPAAMLVNRKVLDKIYGFDNRYFATYEDTDFCFRANKVGFKTIYIPNAVATHKISSQKREERERLLSRGYWIGRNRVLFMGDYGKNFYLFLFFLPIHFFYFLIIASAQNNTKGLISYLKGLYAGLIEELISRRILVHMPFSMYSNLFHIIGNGPRTVLDIACADGMSMSILDYKRQWKVTGIDIYEAYVKRARERGIYQEVILGDVRKVDQFFKQKFDAVLCSSLVEHLPKKDAIDLLSKLEKLGRKVIVSGIPNGYLEKEEPHFWEGDNHYQIHRSSWSIEDFISRKYTVRGVGVSLFIGSNRLSNKLQDKRLASFRLIILFLENILAYIFAPVPFYFPKYSVGLLAVRDLKKNKK